MKVIFYDRKNKREVSNEELIPTRLIQNIAIIDDDDSLVPTGRRLTGRGDAYTKEEYFNFITVRELPLWEDMKIEKTPIVLHTREQLIADLFYRSETCPSYVNGDLYCTITDLVFLRLES